MTSSSSSAGRAVLVTGLFRLDDDADAELKDGSIKSVEFRINKFKEMLQIINGEIFFHVFVDEAYYEMLKESIAGIRFKGVIQKASLKSLRAFKIVEKRKESFILPNDATPHKDTRNFLVLMNSKTELVKNAILFHNAHTKDLSDAFRDYEDDDDDDGKSTNVERKKNKYGWIDFNIGHVFKSPSETFQILKQKINSICCKGDKESLYIPGCRTEKPISFDLHKVNWRFCGGFFFGDAESILKFDRYYDYVFEMFDVLTWEVNMWNIFEAFGWKPKNWYEADHDDRMVTNIPVTTELVKVVTSPPKTMVASSSPDVSIKGSPKANVCVSTETSSNHHHHHPSSKQHHALAHKRVKVNTKSSHLRRTDKDGPLVKFIVGEIDDEISTQPSLTTIRFLSHGASSSDKDEDAEAEEVSFASSASASSRDCLSHLIPFDDETFENGLASTLEFYGVEHEDKVWENKRSVLFWRGAFSEHSKLRKLLVEEATTTRQNYYDIKFVKDAASFSSSTSFASSSLSSSTSWWTKRASQKEHLRHKFLLSIPHDDCGQVGSNLQWIFGSGSVPIILMNTNVNFWFKKYVKHMENCVVVTYSSRKDSSNIEDLCEGKFEKVLEELKQKIEWLKENDDSAKRIASKALELSEKIFSHSFQSNYIRSLVLETS